MAAAGSHEVPSRCFGKTPLSRAEGETDQKAGKKHNKEGHWYVVEMNVAERKATVRVGTGAEGGWGDSERVHADAAAVLQSSQFWPNAARTTCTPNKC